MISRNLAWLGAALALALVPALPAQARQAAAQTPAPSQVRTDHHMHVHSPAILAFLPGYCSSPGRKGKCDPRFTQPLTIQDALAQLDEAGIQRGWLMSTAYLAESPMMQPPVADAPAILRAANDFTVEQARRWPDRFSTFVGIDPITDTALPEIARWKGDPAVTGIKLHLTNSDVDLRSPEQVGKLAAVFRAASANGWIIMIHMRTRAADYGARDVRTFIKDVLPAAGDRPVMIAHAAGWGGIDAVTLDALGAFADALEQDPALGRNLYFDLAQVFDDKASADDKARMATLMRRIGIGHFVAGSDWPFSGDLKTYYAQVYAPPPLTPAEWNSIRTNRIGDDGAH
jgi:predicted TIM-barrel fold metal-dependent hydrolase